MREWSAFALVTVLGCGSSGASIATSDASADATTTTTPGVDAAPPSIDASEDGDAAGDAGVDCTLHASRSLLDLVAAVVSAMRAGAGAGSNALAVPATADRDAFASLVVRALDGDPQAACDLPAPYRVLVLDDPAAGALRVVAELDAAGAPAPSRYWGTYAAPAVVPAHGRALVVEAPHPIFDANTEAESADVFVRASARYFLLAGSHRCADDAASPCSGATTACAGSSAPYRVSDAAHADALPFYAVHAALSAKAPALSFLQLHGNTASCPDALVSDDSGHWSDAGLAGALAGALTARGVGVGQCGAGYPTATCDLCGLDNVEARFTAGASAACTAMGPTAGYGRFVHVEQQPGLRKSPDAGAGGYAPLVDAVLAAFPAQ